VSASLRLADLDDRIRLILQLVLRNQREIRGQPRGVLEIKFHGRHVEAVLHSRQRLTLDEDDDDRGPPSAA
jgi:hypothetical protein